MIWLMQRIDQQASLRLPVYIAALALVIWTLVAIRHILRAALRAPAGAVPGAGAAADAGGGAAVPADIRPRIRSAMHVHILGICGTFMGGIAAIARAAGFRVTGSDRNVYPPMSTQLRALGIELIEGYEAAQLTPAPDDDRGRQRHDARHAGDRGACSIAACPIRSGPRVAGARRCCASAGCWRWPARTARPRPARMLAWILEDAGLSPGFLIGGVPENFGLSARLGERAVLRHRGRRVRHRVLRQAREVRALPAAHAGAEQSRVRSRRHLSGPRRDRAPVPPSGAHRAGQRPHRLCNGADATLARGAGRGLLERRREIRARRRRRACTGARRRSPTSDFSRFEVLYDGRSCGEVHWNLIGAHNMDNALAAIAAARHAGVPVERGIGALGPFPGRCAPHAAARRGGRGASVYDDFAHHPTAIATTLDGLRRRVGRERASSPCSSRARTPCAWACTRRRCRRRWRAPIEVWLYAPPGPGLERRARRCAPLGERAHVAQDLDTLVRGAVAYAARPAITRSS